MTDETKIRPSESMETDCSPYRLRTRGAPCAKRPLVFRDDILKFLMLPIWFTLAWAVPQRYWKPVCTLQARLAAWGRFNRSTHISRAIASALPDGIGGRDAGSVWLELEASRYEHYFQVLRDYRSGGWRTGARVRGLRHLEKLQGRGAVLWIAHFVFNGLAPKKELFLAGYPLIHLSRPEHGFSKTRFGIRILNPLRRRVEDWYLRERVVIDDMSGIRAVRRLDRLLRQGAICSITAGAWEGRQVVEVPLFGRRIPLATGALSLAYSAKVPLLPVFVIRDGDGCIDVDIGDAIRVPEVFDKRDALGPMAAEFARRLEEYIRRAPGQWRGWHYLS